jgi:hypothetical protein
MWRRTPDFRSRRRSAFASIGVRSFRNSNGSTGRWFIGAIFVLVLFGALWESRRFNAAGGSTARIAIDAGLEAPPPVLAVFNKSCIDCHSEQTRWPWYAHIPPASWLIDRDVSHARRAMNLSRLVSGPGGPSAAVSVLSAICKMTQEQRMPPLRYRLMHPNSGLSGNDKAVLCGWATKESARLSQRAEQSAARQN